MSTVDETEFSRTSTPFRGFTEDDIEATNPLTGFMLGDDSEDTVDSETAADKPTPNSTVKKEASKMAELKELSDIKDEWSKNQDEMKHSLDDVHDTLDSFNEVLDQYAEDGDIDTVKTFWTDLCKPKYNTTKAQINRISSYDTEILEQEGDGNPTSKQVKKPLIEETK